MALGMIMIDMETVRIVMVAVTRDVRILADTIFMAAIARIAVLLLNPAINSGGKTSNNGAEP